MEKTTLNSQSSLATINLVLEDGTLDGILYITKLRWALSGIMLVSPRDKVEDLLNLEPYETLCSYWGIYLLVSENQVYIGQASELKARIKQHLYGKDWWERVFILTTSNNSLGKSEIDYLEDELIKKSIKANKLNSDNKKSGNKNNLSYIIKAELNEYLKDALFILSFINVNVFENNKKESINIESLSNLVTAKSEEQKITRNKNEIFSYVKEKTNIDLTKNSYYSKFYIDKNQYWFTLSNNVIAKNLKLVLNNIINQEIIIIEIPANTFNISKNKDNNHFFQTRKDERFDLYISPDFIEKTNEIDLSKFIIKRINY